jgi:hypothetical protein
LGKDHLAVPKVIHPVSGGIAIHVTATFWLSTVASELFYALKTPALMPFAPIGDSPDPTRFRSMTCVVPGQ